jgi:hypothetical protein
LKEALLGPILLNPIKALPKAVIQPEAIVVRVTSKTAPILLVKNILPYATLDNHKEVLREPCPTLAAVAVLLPMLISKQ